jgi:hypothetical protein
MRSDDADMARLDLKEALNREGCAVCRLVARSGRSYLDNLLYEQVNDEEAQREFRASLGLCGRHADRMLEAGNGLGAAILYGAATRELADLLSRTRDAPKPKTPLRTLLGRPAAAGPSIPEPGEGCMVCRAEARAEERYLGVLLDGAEDGYLDGLLEGPGAICVKHLSRASALAGGWLPKALVETTLRTARELNEDLGRYVRHNDYRFRDEPWGEERHAPRRAVQRMLGWGT